MTTLKRQQENTMRERGMKQIGSERKAWRIHSTPRHFEMLPLVQSFQSIVGNVERGDLTGIHSFSSVPPSRPVCFSIFVFDKVVAPSALLRFTVLRDRIMKRSQTVQAGAAFV